MHPNLPLIVTLTALYCLLSGVLYQVFQHRPGERQEGYIVFTNTQTFWLCTLWPLTFLAVLYVFIKVRIPKRPEEGFDLELVKVGRGELKVHLFHPQYGPFTFHYNPCTYRRWYYGWLPGFAKQGWRIKVPYGIYDPRDMPFAGRISTHVVEQQMLDEVIPDFKELITKQYAQPIR